MTTRPLESCDPTDIAKLTTLLTNMVDPGSTDYLHTPHDPLSREYAHGYRDNIRQDMDCLGIGLWWATLVTKEVFSRTDDEASLIRHVARREYYVDRIYEQKLLSRMPDKATALDSVAAAIQRALPWAFVAQSQDDSRQWSWFNTLEHARVGRRTRSRVGRFLTKYEEDLVPMLPHHLLDDGYAQFAAKVSNMWALHAAPVQVQFATDADDIERVYNEGPHSCMSYNADKFISDEHPVRAYESPDIRLAYVEQNGRIVARTLLNEVYKQYSTIYGNTDAIRDPLRDLGYTSGDLSGCRLSHLIDCNTDSPILPYLDGEQRVGHFDDNRYLRVYDRHESGSGWDYDACSVNGILDDYNTRIECSHCGERFDEDDVNMISDDPVCEGCTDEYYTFAIVGGWRSQRTGNILPEHEWCEDRYNEFFEYEGELYTAEGLEVCELGFCAHYGEVFKMDELCDVDGETYHIDLCELCEECDDYKLTQHFKDVLINVKEEEEMRVCSDCAYAHERNNEINKITEEVMETIDNA